MVNWDELLSYKTPKLLVVHDRAVGIFRWFGMSLVIVYMVYQIWVSKVYLGCIPGGSVVTSLSGYFLGTRTMILSNDQCNTLGMNRQKRSNYMLETSVAAKSEACVSFNMMDCTRQQGCMFFDTGHGSICLEADVEFSFGVVVKDSKDSNTDGQLHSALNAMDLQAKYWGMADNITQVLTNEIPPFDLDTHVLGPRETAVFIQLSDSSVGLRPQFGNMLNNWDNFVVDFLMSMSDLTVTYVSKATSTSTAGGYTVSVSSNAPSMTTALLPPNPPTGVEDATSIGKHKFSVGKKSKGMSASNVERLVSPTAGNECKESGEGVFLLTCVYPLEEVHTIVESTANDIIYINLGSIQSASYATDSFFIFSQFTGMGDFFIDFDFRLINNLYKNNPIPVYGGDLSGFAVDLVDKSGAVVSGCIDYGLRAADTNAPKSCTIKDRACSYQVGDLSTKLAFPLGALMESAGYHLKMNIKQVKEMQMHQGTYDDDDDDGLDAVSKCVAVCKKSLGFNDEESFDKIRTLEFGQYIVFKANSTDYGVVIQYIEQTCLDAPWQLLGGTLIVMIDYNNLPQRDTKMTSKGSVYGPFHEDFVYVTMRTTFEIGDGTHQSIKIMFGHEGIVCEASFQTLLVNLSASVALFASAAMLSEFALRFRRPRVYKKKFQTEIKGEKVVPMEYEGEEGEEEETKSYFAFRSKPQAKRSTTHFVTKKHTTAVLEPAETQFVTKESTKEIELVKPEAAESSLSPPKAS